MAALQGEALLRWLVDKREAKNLTQAEVDRRTKAIGQDVRISQPYLSQIEKGDRPLTDLGPAKMDALRAVYSIPPFEWVEKTGLSIITSNPLDIKQPGFHPEPMYPSRLVAHYGTVGAGLDPMAHAEHFPEQKPFPNVPGLEGYRDEDLFLLDVVGDSMACEEVHKHIPEGSTAIFHARLEPVPNVSIVAVWLEKEQTGVLKLYTHDDGHVVLRSYNDHHKPIILSPDDRDYLQGVYLTHVAPVRHPKQMKFRK